MSDEVRNIDQNIRMRAYLMWEAEGKQEGRAERYWHRARELIASQPGIIADGIASPKRSITVTPRDGQPDRLPTAEEQELQYELFWRDLNEVHLLMDFVSGRADKSLADLKDVPNPANPAESLRPEEVVEQVCLIRFPPVGDATRRAQQAALLLTIKDRLNGLANPARGLTIAYTAMFSGVSLSEWTRTPSRLYTFLADRLGFLVRQKQPDPEARQASYAFATKAYPNLKRQAQTFRYWFARLPWLAVVWAILTALVYWDVALSSATLNKVNTFVEQEAALGQPGHTFIPTVDRCETPKADALPADDRATCDKFTVLQNGLTTARADLTALTERHLWRHPVGWVMRCFSGKENRIGSVTTPREQFAVVVVGIFTNYIVPMMFGLLGTLAGVVRSTWAKVQGSTLRPQDARLAVASVPLGLVAGLAIGLIVSPSNTAPQGVTTVAGSITLSATALAFLAGYGAEAFFTMMDELLKRIFAIGSSATSK